MSHDPTDLRSRLDRFRALQTGIEDVILALASSLDGRTFSFQAPFTTTSFFPGHYVTLERDGAPPLLAQVLAARVDRVRAGSVDGLEVGDDDASMQVTGDVTVRVLAGEGVILSEVAEDAVAPPPAGQAFRDAVLRLASADEIRRYLETAGADGAALEIGRALFVDDQVPAFLDASGFNRHTFLCGQSGSGKTYALGIVVERLLLETDLRMIVLDPNSDFVRLDNLHPDVDATGGPGRRFQEAAARVRVLRPDTPESGLCLRFSDLDAAAQARVLQLDPLEHREEYDLYQRTIEELGRSEYSLADVAERLLGDESEEARLLALRLRNLGIAAWGLWADGGSLVDELDGGGWQCLVLDVGGLELPAERAVVAEAVLAYLWRERRRREPVLVVVDEAHNICPQEPEDAVTALATELAVLIAGEGRKFGLYLLVASQRPAKIHANVLSQCENLVLMRMNSLGDLDHVRTVFSHTPATLVEQSSTFRLGESLLAGRIVPNPTFVRFSGRLSLEGGGDISSSWAKTT